MLNPVTLNFLAVPLDDSCRRIFLTVTEQELKIISVIQPGIAVMDKPCVMGNQAVLCLTENFIQHCNRHKAALDQFFEYISRSYAGQLVRVSD